MSNLIKIFDTTLRDGEQAPGCSMNENEKLKVALNLEKLGVNIIEAGFPIASEGDFNSVKLIAKNIKDCEVAGLSRANLKDIDRAWEAIKDAANPRIHTFIATSNIHLKYKLKKTKEEVLSIIKTSVSHSAKYTNNVEFSCEDATRTDLDFLYQSIKVAIKAGATTINIPDTVGYSVPSEFGGIIKKLYQNVDEVSSVTLSVHCHNDLGLAVANSLAAIHEGARQVECTINGLGERAGNASLEELVMALKVRNDLNPFITKLDTKQIYPCSKLVSSVTGVSVQPNKAIVGANAFAHEAGIHQDGVLKQSTTYEIMDPSEVGIPSNHIVLGKHSGRHAFKDRLNQFGYELSDEDFQIAFVKFKELCDKKKYIFDEDIFSLINEEFMRLSDFYQLESVECSSGTEVKPRATIVVNVDGELIEAEESGAGPMDSVFKAISKVVGITPILDSYSVASVTEGMDAQAEVSVSIKHDDFFARGKGANTDVIVASAKAFINALNNLRWRKNHPKIASTKGV
jgi:2-isopropylmalate synthase|tara:strand:+ start:2188 stop:3729 length:1542 start_codon:yes stop_codon:yes gene_type:complete